MEEKIFNDGCTLEDALEEQRKFENKINKFKESVKPKTLEKMLKKGLLFKAHLAFLEKDKNFLIALKVKHFQ